MPIQIELTEWFYSDANLPPITTYPVSTHRYKMEGKARNEDKQSINSMCSHTLLTAEEERTLGTLALTGDQTAIDKLVTHNIRLVAHIAKHFVTSRITLGDAISIGTIGLIGAAKRYDPKRGTKFSTHATWWIREALLEAYWEQKSGIIHIPTYIGELERKVARGEDITPKEQVCKERAERARVAYGNVYALPPDNDPVVEEEEDSPDADLIELMMAKLKLLTPYDQYILKARFGLPPNPRRMLLHEIGEVEGISKERVRQIENRAMERLRALILEGKS